MLEIKRALEHEDKINKKYDVIIIGGGITGAALVYILALMGHKALLLEQNDFSQGTSSGTSKLIHGGLRYLEQGRLLLVRQLLGERKIFSQIAPNFIYPLPTILSAYNRKDRILYKLGHIAYDILSFDKSRVKDKSKKMPGHSSLSYETAMDLGRILRADILAGADAYYDCLNINPERVTLAFIKSAIYNGANAANYARVENFIRNNGRIAGVCVRDMLNDKEYEIESKLVINCGGPWVNKIINIAANNTGAAPIIRSEGVHIITKKLLGEHMVAASSPRKRFVFAIPWRNHTLFGTNDIDYSGDPDNYILTRKSIDDLLDDLAGAFNIGRLADKDILYAYGRLRPQNDYEASRGSEVIDHARDGLDGLISVIGGKFITGRVVAEKTAKLVAKKLKRRYKKPHSEKLYLYGSNIPDMEKFMYKFHKAYDKRFSPDTIEYLCRNYGTECHKILRLAILDKNMAKVLNKDGEIMAEVKYACGEMARTLSDIVFRRTGLGTLGPGYIDNEILNKVAYTAGRNLGWTFKRIIEEIKKTKNEMKLPE